MSRKSKYPVEDRRIAAEDYLSGKRSTAQICKDLGMPIQDGYQKMLRTWAYQYQSFGIEAFLPKHKDQKKAGETGHKTVYVWRWPLYRQRAHGRIVGYFEV